MASIDDVARLAGVSTATVSRALRGLPTVSQTTRELLGDGAMGMFNWVWKGIDTSIRPGPFLNHNPIGS